MSKTNRRKFVKTLASSSLALGTGTYAYGEDTHELLFNPPKYSANDTIKVAAIGMGIMGFNNCRTTVKVPGVELVAVCDLYDGRMERAKEVFGNHLVTTKNYKEILARKDIDAVIISTSDHWHDHITIAALESGKSVYCEKPMVHKIEEGKAVIAAEKKSGKILQIGSQGVSSIMTIKAAELYQQGAIGDLVLGEILSDRRGAIGAWQYSIPTDASPQTVDWENYIGDAPKIPYDEKHFFWWRNYQAYGTGVAGDLFVHMLSAVHRITGSTGPQKIASMGGLRYWKDGRDVPDIMLANMDYPKAATHEGFNLQLRVNFIGGGGGIWKLIGTEGSIELKGNQLILTKRPNSEAPGYGNWDSYDTYTEKQQAEFKKWYEAKYPVAPPKMNEPKEVLFSMPKDYDSHYHHHLNFYTAIRNNGKVVEDGTFGFRAAAPALAANKSYFEDKIIHWDADKMELK